MSREESDVARGAAALMAHAEECDECRTVRLPMAGLNALLSAAEEPPLEVSELSARAMVRLRREVRVLAPASWRALMPRLLRALLPLPLVLVVDAYVLRVVYRMGSAVFPDGLVAYWVCSYGAFLLLMFALTYAMVPLLLMRQWRVAPLDER